MNKLLTPRDYQIEAIYAVLNYFYENITGNTLVAMPTGSGKAACICGLIHLLMFKWPHLKILQLVDSQELVEQNAKTLERMWPNAPKGVFCAGLDLKQLGFPIIFGSLGSVRNSIKLFGHFDFVLIDEVQGVSPDEETGYRLILSALTKINPNLRTCGYSATIFRAGQGYLTEDTKTSPAFFNDVCFNITTLSQFNRLIAEKWLAPLVPKETSFVLDVSSVGKSKGDYAQGKLQKAVDKQEITWAALKEACQIGFNRHCWLVFASGIEHCEHIAEMLQTLGISSTFVHSKITKDERRERILAFKTGEIKALVGYKIFLKGFDHAPIDFLIDLYPTVSCNTHVQKLGRGTRPYDYTNSAQYIKGFDYIKHNCLVADFANNVRTLGPINDPKVPRKKGDKEGEAPIKLCEHVENDVKCGIYNHSSYRYCGGKPYPSDEGCGAEFIFKTKLLRAAGTDAIIAGDVPTIEIFDVNRVLYHKHTKIGSSPSLKVSYFVGLQRYTEWIGIEAKGYAHTRAKSWWQQRHASDIPETVDEALLFVSQLRTPKRIHVITSSQYPEIRNVEW